MAHQDSANRPSTIALVPIPRALPVLAARHHTMIDSAIGFLTARSIARFASALFAVRSLPPSQNSPDPCRTAEPGPSTTEPGPRAATPGPCPATPGTSIASPAAGLKLAGSHAPLTALAVTLGVQMIASVAQTTPSVLAPVIAGEIGVGAQNVGWLVSLSYLAAMLSGLNGGLLATRHGSVRLSQVALLSSASGMFLIALGHPVFLMAGAVLFGIGYGITNPAAAEILSRHAPADRRGLFFSIKQTGVPLGVATAGLAIPALLAFLNWSKVVATLGVLMLAAAWAIGLSRRRLEARGAARPGATTPIAAVAGGSTTGGSTTGGSTAGGSTADRQASPGRPSIIESLQSRLITPLREVMAFAPTRRLGFTSLVYAFTQVSFLTFLVSLLKLEHHYTLALAASLLAASQAASVVARIAWGHVADRWIDPTRLLGMLGVMTAAAMLLLGLAPPDTSSVAMLLIALACAATAVSWNGVYYADLVRHVPQHRVAQATGATQFLTFMGGMSGSAVFAGLVSLTGSYSTTFAGLALLPAITGLVLLTATRLEPPVAARDQPEISRPER